MRPRRKGSPWTTPTCSGVIRSSIRERWRCCGLAALDAVGGAVPSYGAQADAAVDAGATAAEIVDVLVGVIPVVGCDILGLESQVSTLTAAWPASSRRLMRAAAERTAGQGETACGDRRDNRSAFPREARSAIVGCSTSPARPVAPSSSVTGTSVELMMLRSVVITPWSRHRCFLRISQSR